MNTPPNNAPSWAKLLDLMSTNWETHRWRNVGVVIGCSGGADSVALLRLMAELRTQGNNLPRGFLIAAHFNHALRGTDGSTRMSDAKGVVLTFRPFRKWR